MPDSHTDSKLSLQSPPATRSPTTQTSANPRNRRIISSHENENGEVSVQKRFDPNQRSHRPLHTSFGAAAASQLPARPVRSARPAPNADTQPASLSNFLSSSLTQSWTSVQDITTGLFAFGGHNPDVAATPSRGRHNPQRRNLGRENTTTRLWGPTPPNRAPGLNDVGSGSAAQRGAALKAVRTASVLENHAGVNDGLDVAAAHKRRNSDKLEALCSDPDDCHVYIHHVRADDTYAGIVLRYRCREDAFRRANGLWSRDSIQTRKWLAIPVEACEIRSRPCPAPSTINADVGPIGTVEPRRNSDYPAKDRPDHRFRDIADHTSQSEEAQEEDKPWTHVKWVQLDSIPEPLEVGRLARHAMGFFPPRRKKSNRTMTSSSTPRQSTDILGSPGCSIQHPSPRRLSSSSGQPHLSTASGSTYACSGNEATDHRPAWMRRSGGVGSLGTHVHAPGPGRDYFNSWTRKHIPGLNMEGLPSMSVMGSEIARLGFSSNSTGIVESPSDVGQNVSSTSRQGSGLDRAAAAVESWLRGAFAKRVGTPLMSSGSRELDLFDRELEGDLIELAGTESTEHANTACDNTSSAALERHSPEQTRSTFDYNALVPRDRTRRRVSNASRIKAD